MKPNRIFILTLFTLVLTASSFGQGKAPKNYKQLQYPKMREIQIPDPARVELPNG
ncbi:MAG: hypothetical protein HW374_1962, partial [Bacteroidetes bacterium]|nr:hypothetical protein [Bacteroidota bacterium]